MHFVYIIQSINNPEKFYIGYTLDVIDRLSMHNQGKSLYCRKFMPWQLVWFAGFSDKLKALEFEKYLKSHPGRTFIKKKLT